MTDWTPDIVQELRAQGVKVTPITPQDDRWHIEGKYILTTRQMKYLKQWDKLNLDGIEELHNILLGQQHLPRPDRNT